MKYYELSLGVDSEIYGNKFSYTEITEERFSYLKERFFCGYYITWDFSSNYGIGYSTGIATDENFEDIKKLMFQKIYDFIKNVIDCKTKEIEDLNDVVKKLSMHPIYHAITIANLREEKINTILN